MRVFMAEGWKESNYTVYAGGLFFFVLNSRVEELSETGVNHLVHILLYKINFYTICKRLLSLPVDETYSMYV